MVTPPPFPHPSGHVVSIDPCPEGWRAWCLPHGELAVHPDHLSAFIAAAVHDAENGGDTTIDPARAPRGALGS